MLDYIVINQYLPILQTPSNHYCNTLKAPILQIVIYLYCRVQFAGLHHLKGVIEISNLMPQVATGCPTFLPGLSQILLKSMKTHKNQWGSMQINVLALIGNVQASPRPPKPSNLPEINDNQ